MFPWGKKNPGDNKNIVPAAPRFSKQRPLTEISADSPFAAAPTSPVPGLPQGHAGRACGTVLAPATAERRRSRRYGSPRRATTPFLKTTALLLLLRRLRVVRFGSERDDPPPPPPSLQLARRLRTGTGGVNDRHRGGTG